MLLLSMLAALVDTVNTPFSDYWKTYLWSNIFSRNLSNPSNHMTMEEFLEVEKNPKMF